MMEVTAQRMSMVSSFSNVPVRLIRANFGSQLVSRLDGEFVFSHIFGDWA